MLILNSFPHYTWLWSYECKVIVFVFRSGRNLGGEGNGDTLRWREKLLSLQPTEWQKAGKQSQRVHTGQRARGRGERENLGKMLETVAWKVEKRHQEDGDCGEMLSFWWQFQFAVVCYPDFPLTLLHSFVAYIYHIEWPFYIVFLQRVLRGCCGLNCRWRRLLGVRPFIIQFITSGTHVCWIIEHVPASCSVTKLIFT